MDDGAEVSHAQTHSSVPTQDLRNPVSSKSIRNSQALGAQALGEQRRLLVDALARSPTFAPTAFVARAAVGRIFRETAGCALTPRLIAAGDSSFGFPRRIAQREFGEICGRSVVRAAAQPRSRRL